MECAERKVGGKMHVEGSRDGEGKSALMQLKVYSHHLTLCPPEAKHFIGRTCSSDQGQSRSFTLTHLFQKYSTSRTASAGSPACVAARDSQNSSWMLGRDRLLDLIKWFASSRVRSIPIACRTSLPPKHPAQGLQRRTRAKQLLLTPDGVT